MSRICILTLLAAMVLAQEFEVASIRLNRSGSDSSSMQMHPEGVTITNTTLRALILNAQGLKAYQLIGGPTWLDRNRFDIAAKMPPRTNSEDARKMMQTLLANRFALRLRQETRKMPLFELQHAASGPKLKAADGPNQSSTMRESITGQMTIATLSDALSRVAGRPVIDRTGIRGRYRVELRWSGPDSASASAYPDLMTAIQEQLGLKLDPAQGDVEVWIVERAESPSEISLVTRLSQL